MDYMYPSIFFSYFLFFLLTGLTGYFCVRSIKNGDLGRDSEEPKHRMMQDDTDGGFHGR
jgi:hypothetical protein